MHTSNISLVTKCVPSTIDCVYTIHNTFTMNNNRKTIIRKENNIFNLFAHAKNNFKTKRKTIYRAKQRNNFACEDLVFYCLKWQYNWI